MRSKKQLYPQFEIHQDNDMTLTDQHQDDADTC